MIEGYDAGQAYRDAMLNQISDKKLQRDILFKELDRKSTINAGLALVQSKLKLEGLNLEILKCKK